MKHTTEAQARHHATRSLENFKGEVKTLVVSEAGDVFINGDLDEVKKELDLEEKKYFVLKGEEAQKVKAPKKKKDGI
jgi:hypothetical protein